MDSFPDPGKRQISPTSARNAMGTILFPQTPRGRGLVFSDLEQKRKKLEKGLASFQESGNVYS